MVNVDVVTIESTEQEDYTSWLPLWIDYQTFYRTKISDEVAKLTQERFLTPSEPVCCAVARYNGEVVGLVHYLFHHSTWAESNYCYLEGLSVNEDVHGQRIDKQLIEYVQQRTKKHHASGLYWHTRETNLHGQRLYDWVAKKSEMIEYQM